MHRAVWLDFGIREVRDCGNFTEYQIVTFAGGVRAYCENGLRIVHAPDAPHTWVSGRKASVLTCNRCKHRTCRCKVLPVAVASGAPQCDAASHGGIEQ
jgi:hypothetical protein